MATRQTQPVTSTPKKGFGLADSMTETHPAFGVAVVTRGSGSARTLFQSDVLHHEAITLSIQTADRNRDLNHDYVFPRNVLVEVEMSLSQWGALVSSVGLGSGVPVTIRRTATEHRVPDLPYEPRIKASLDEVNATVGRLVEHVRVTLAALNEAIESKQGVKVIREAMRDHAAAVEHMEANAEFAVKSLTAAGEKVTSQVRADIESQILAANNSVTQVAITAPEMHLTELEG